MSDATWGLLVLTMLSVGCVGEEASVQTDPQPETTVPPATPPIVVIEEVQTTIPSTTKQPETFKPTEPPKPRPVSDYASAVLGINHGFDFSSLGEDASLDSNDRALIDAIYNIPVGQWQYLGFNDVVEDGVVDDKELAYVELCSKLPEKLKAINTISEKNASLIILLNTFSEENPSDIRSLFDVIDRYDTGYISHFQMAYMERAFGYGIEDIVFDPAFHGSYVGEAALNKLNEYIGIEEAHKELSMESTRFSGMPQGQQGLILSMPWVKDGISEDDARYIDSLPIDLDLTDRKKDTDNGGWPDRYEMRAKGDVRNGPDDLLLQIDETEHFMVELKRNVTPTVIRDILLALEDGYEENKNIFDMAPTASVRIYADHTEFEKALGGKTHPWLIGTIEGSVILLQSPLSWLPRSNLDKVMVHEYTHIVLLNIVFFAPTWLDEGIATYVAKQIPDKPKSDCRDYTLPIMLSVPDPEVYTCGYYAVEYLIDEYGMQSMKNILYEIGDGKSVNRAFLSVVGKDQRGFEREWKSTL